MRTPAACTASRSRGMLGPGRCRRPGRRASPTSRCRGGAEIAPQITRLRWQIDGIDQHADQDDDAELDHAHGAGEHDRRNRIGGRFGGARKRLRRQGAGRLPARRRAAGHGGSARAQRRTDVGIGHCRTHYKSAPADVRPPGLTSAPKLLGIDRQERLIATSKMPLTLAARRHRLGIGGKHAVDHAVDAETVGDPPTQGGGRCRGLLRPVESGE